MRKITFIALVLVLQLVVNAQNLKPYIYGASSSKSMAEITHELTANLKASGLKVVGDYQAAKDVNRRVIVITDASLIEAVKKQGGHKAFAASLRVAITKENGKMVISYTNPSYWGNAYFGSKYNEVASVYQSIDSKLKIAMKQSGQYVGTAFGSVEGISADDLQEYQYMFGMPEFDDVVELKEFASFAAGKASIEAGLKSSKTLSLVYSIEIPGKNQKLYGIALNGSGGESAFLPIIDLSTPKHTAFLPYEIVLDNDELIMLHGRYRIALAFPDLSMSTFTKIMSTPGNIEDAMKSICK